VWGGGHIIRAGLASVSNGQRETVYAFELDGWKGLLLVIVPQAMVAILPPYISLVTGLLQASSLGAVLGLNEFLRSAQILVEQTRISRGGSPAYLICGTILVVYFVLCCAGRSRSLDIVSNGISRRHTAETGSTSIATRVHLAFQRQQLR
jgi:polar amino acid transport system permease protein